MKKLLILTGAAAITLAGAMQARAALKYETGDYAAQDALVMHLDGIRNVGANRAHDPNASTWIDLAGKAGAITLVKRDASDVSAWTDKGYFWLFRHRCGSVHAAFRAFSPLFMVI